MGGVNMSKNSMYNDLVKCKIFNATDVESTKIYENDIVIESEYANVNKKYKIETDNMSNNDIIISLLAKQTLYIKTIKNISVLILILYILGIIVLK